MIVLPAVDIREGACVQLVGGDYQAERVRLQDPVAVAAEWATLGFRELHLVDLDRATRRGNNDAIVGAILASGEQRVQVGGGFASEERIDWALEGGANAVVVGTRAVEDLTWLGQVAERWPNRIVVAADVAEREVVTRGWAHRTGIMIGDFLGRLDQLPLGGVLITAVHREGQLGGPDLELAAVAKQSRHPIQMSGGIRSLADLRALDKAGASKAVVGMAFYTGQLERHLAAKEFGS